MVVTPSLHSYGETARRLIEAIDGRSLQLFARIDHAGAAREVSLELPNEEVFVFGNPRAGTPLMRSDPQVGIELPLRILIWADGDGVSLGFNDPRELESRYGIAEHKATLDQMATLLARIVAEAAG
jgi:uncharacterized protein (DUF302 family)